MSWPPKVANRVIFALSFNRSRLNQTFFPSIINNALVSYFYVNKPGAQAHASAIELLTRVRNKVGTLFMDSGVFSLKVKFTGAHVGAKPGTMPADLRDKINARLDKHRPYFVDFAKNYARFLRDYDHLYDWAFDLDVDQFMGIPMADKMYRMLRDNIPNPRKIIRVWHATRTFGDWVKWCESGEYDYLAVEGGASHSRDYDFYRKFVDVAHKHNIRVHVLALTDPRFLTKVNIDTGDSSSWMVGSRYGQLYTPFGLYNLGTRIGAKNHWDGLVEEEKHKILAWLKKVGIKTTGKELKKRWQVREMGNIAYFLLMDKKYNEENGNVKRNSFL